MTADDRLRGFVRDLKAHPAAGGPSPIEWQALVTKWELEASDQARLAELAANQFQRGWQAASQNRWETAAAEWEGWPVLVSQQPVELEKAVVKLGPLLAQAEAAAALSEAVAALSATYLKASQNSQRAKTFLRKQLPALPSPAQAGRRSATPKAVTGPDRPFWKRPLGLWSLIIAGLLVLGGVGGWAAKTFFFGPAVGASGLTATQPPTGDQRVIPLQVDAGSLRFQIRQPDSRVAVFPEAELYTLQSHLVFPDLTVTALEASLLLVDQDRNTVASTDFVLIAADKTPLAPGIALPLTQRLDITGKAASVTAAVLQLRNVHTSQDPQAPQHEVSLIADPPLEKGFNPALTLTGDSWAPAFAGRSQNFQGSLLNKGLKPIRSLVIDIQWQDRAAHLLKTVSVVVVSPNQTPLAPGLATRFQAAGDFPEEIYHLTDADLPRPIFIIRELD